MKGSGEPRRRLRRRTVRRWTPAILSLGLLAAALVTVVRRSEDGRERAMRLQALESEAEVISDQIVAEEARIDTLTGLSRIEEAAGALGMRRADARELVQVRDRPETRAEGGR